MKKHVDLSEVIRELTRELGRVRMAKLTPKQREDLARRAIGIGPSLFARQIGRIRRESIPTPRITPRYSRSRRGRGTGAG